MVSVAAGPFLRGCNTVEDGNCFSDEYPYRQLRLSAFHIDTHEVTTGEYRACVQAGGCLDTNLAFDPSFCNYAYTGRDDHPINCVDYTGTRILLMGGQGVANRKRNGRKAARGPNGGIYPWGNNPVPSCTHAVMNNGALTGCGEGSTSPVGSRQLGDQPLWCFGYVRQCLRVDARLVVGFVLYERARERPNGTVQYRW